MRSLRQSLIFGPSPAVHTRAESVACPASATDRSRRMTSSPIRSSPAPEQGKAILLRRYLLLAPRTPAENVAPRSRLDRSPPHRAGHPFAHAPEWGSGQPEQSGRAVTSLRSLLRPALYLCRFHPALARNPLHCSPGPYIHKRLCVLIGKPLSPFREPGFRKLETF